MSRRTEIGSQRDINRNVREGKEMLRIVANWIPQADRRMQSETVEIGDVPSVANARVTAQLRLRWIVFHRGRYQQSI